MKEKKSTLQIIKKIAIILFCALTVSMNIANYLRADEYKGLGTVFQWSQESEIDDFSEDISESRQITGEEDKNVETGDFALVNLNTASSSELQSLNGIGPSKAAAIVEYRDKYGSFVAIEEIMEVPGIGEGIFSKIKDYICID